MKLTVLHVSEKTPFDQYCVKLVGTMSDKLTGMVRNVYFHFFTPETELKVNDPIDLDLSNYDVKKKPHTYEGREYIDYRLTIKVQ